MRRKLYKHLIETNYRNIASIIKQFKIGRKKRKLKNIMQQTTFGIKKT